MDSLAAFFMRFQQFGDDPALVERRGYRRVVWSYAGLARAAVRVALQLRDRGVRTGDRVLLCAANSPEWVAAFWGCVLRGAVIVPVDYAGSPEFARRVAENSGARVALLSRDIAATTQFEKSLILEDVAVPDANFGPAFRPGARGADLFSLAATLADKPLTRKDILQILFTSGTTGEPRGVVLTHGNFLANLEPVESGFAPYRKYERWFHPLRFVTLVPLSHVFGQFMALLVPPVLGAVIVVENSSNPSDVIATAKRERATALIAVPRMLDTLRRGVERQVESRGKAARFARRFASAEGRRFLRRAWMFRAIHRRFGWKFWAFISGGAALSPDTEAFFRRLGYAVVQGYGMTETASLISLNHPFRAAQGTVGKILPGREFRLAADGEILVRGENVSVGYWEKGALRPSGEEGWLRTGDLGELDAEGNLRFRGRKKSVIVTPAGLNVYPEDLEAALRAQPAVRDCVVVPLARDANAEPCAVLLLASGAGSLEAGAAVQQANASLAEYQRMRRHVIWPQADFPRTATGKPRLAEIAARAGALLHDGAALSSQPSALEQLLDRFTRPAPATPAGGAPQHLERELNLTSLDRVELLTALEERYQLDLNETSFARAKTVADVERLLQQPSAGPRRGREYVYPRWTQSPPVRWLRLAIYYLLVWPATVILAHPRVAGRERLHGLRGPVLVVSNHITRRADIGLILKALPWRFRHRLAAAMEGERLMLMRRPSRDWFFLRRFGYWLGYWLVSALFNVFPLPQRSGFRESFRFAGESVDRGYSLLVFPEGEVTSDGAMTAFQNGVGLLVENLAIPVVPVRLDGVWGMKREARRLAHRGEITVRIGAPVVFPPGTPPGSIARALEKIVREMP